jgi:hypothetical protein
MKSNQKKGFVNMILIGVLFLVLIVGFVFFRTYRSMEESANSRASNSTTSVPKDETANCKNSKYEYEVTYPNGWKVWKLGSQDQIATCDEDLPMATFSPTDYSSIKNIADTKKIVSITISVAGQKDLSNIFHLNNITSLDDFLSGMKKLDSKIVVNNTTTLDGESAVWIENNLQLWTYHNGSIYTIWGINVDQTILNNFISSFKFTK